MKVATQSGGIQTDTTDTNIVYDVDFVIAIELMAALQCFSREPQNRFT